MVFSTLRPHNWDILIFQPSVHAPLCVLSHLMLCIFFSDEQRKRQTPAEIEYFVVDVVHPQETKTCGRRRRRRSCIINPTKVVLLLSSSFLKHPTFLPPSLPPSKTKNNLNVELIPLPLLSPNGEPPLCASQEGYYEPTFPQGQCGNRSLWFSGSLGRK